MLDKLKDIKAIEVINIDYSLYFTALGVFILLIIMLIYFVFRKEKILTKQQQSIKYLKQLDFNNTHIKQIAYDFTVYGKECLDQRYADEFNNIIHKLEVYKYKKNITKNIDSDLIDDMKEYIKVRL